MLERNLIVFECSACGKQLKARAELGGKKVKCPHCGRAAVVPLTETQSMAAAMEERETLPPSDRPASEPTAEHAEQGSSSPEGPEVPGYENLGELGRGGMGVVYKARHLRLKRVVALKMIRAGGTAGEEELARFRTEAEAVARMQHPNIVQVFEVGDYEGQPYFSLEFVDGGSLSSKLAGQPLPGTPAAQIVQTVAEAMDAAHRQGIIHRDLKPANILLQKVEGGRMKDADSSFVFHPSFFVPKVTDFGLAKQLDSDSGQTRTGAIMGTPSYMAPEQVEGTLQIGPAADIYALGAVLYELLTGRPPFRADTPMNTLMQVVADEPAPPSRLQSQVPRDLETICLKCLRKDPKKRYASARALAEDLGRFLAGEPIKARATGTMERTIMWVKRRPAVAGLMAATIILFLAGFALTTWQWLRAEEHRGLAEDKAEAESRARKDADEQRNKADAERRRAQRTLSSLALDRALAAGAQRDGAGALLWLSRSLENVPEDQPALERYLRSSLTAWAGQVWPLAVPALQHDGPVMVVAFSPDGKTVLSGSMDGTARLWESATGKPIGEPLGHDGSVRTAAFSLDGRRVVTGSSMDRRARVWDAMTGKPATPPLDPGEQRAPVMVVAISPDNQVIITADALGNIQRWSAVDGKPIGTSQRHQDIVFGVSFHPDGKSFVTASKDRTAQIWETASGKPLGPPLKHEGEVFAAFFSPDGKTLATGGDDGKVRLWEAAGSRVAQPRGLPLQQGGRITSLAFRPAGAVLASASLDGTVRLWDTGSGTARGLIRQDIQPKSPALSGPPVAGVAFSPDGKSILTTNRNGAWLWDVATSKSLGPPLVHQGGMETAVFSPDGTTILTAGKDLTARLWQIRRRQQGPVQSHPGDAVAAVFSPDGKTIAIGTSFNKPTGEVCIWDGQNSKPAGPLLKLEELVHSVAFHPDGKRLLIGSGLDGQAGKAQIWDTTTGKPLGKPIVHRSGIVTGAAIHPEGDRFLTVTAADFASGDPGQLQMWETATSKPVAGAPAAKGNFTSVAFSPDGHTILTGNHDSLAHLWNADTGQPIGGPLQHPSPVTAVAFSPDGKLVATACFDGAVRLWNAGTGNSTGTHVQHGGRLTAVAFSADSKTLLTGGLSGTKGLTRTWDVASGKPAGFSVAHDTEVTAVAVSPDGKRIAVASELTTRLYDTASGQPLGPQLEQSGRVRALVFNRDGSRLATASDGPYLTLGQIHLLAADTGRLICPPMQHSEIVNSGRAGLPSSLTSLAFSPDGQTILSASLDRTVRLWNVATGKAVGAPMVHPAEVGACVFSPDGRTILSGSRDGTARLWNVATGKVIGAPMLHQSNMVSCAFSPDGRLAATGTHKMVMLWDPRTGKPAAQPLNLGETVVVTGIVFSRDGRLLAPVASTTAPSGNGVQVWETVGGKPIGRFLEHREQVVAVAFDRDGTSLLTAAKEGARLWDIASGQPKTPPLRHPGGFSLLSAAFSPDDKTVLTFGGDARLWEAASGKLIGMPMQHQQGVRTAVFSPDGHLVLTLGMDGVRLWDAASARPLSPPWSLDGSGNFALFSADSRSFVTASTSHGSPSTVETRTRLWQVPPPVEGKSDRISLWVEVLTGTELQADGSLRLLEVADWQDRRRRLQELGGPPLP